MVTHSEILFLLGGRWHDFGAFAARATQMLPQERYAARVSYDFDDLTSLEARKPGVIILYTCLDDETAVRHTDAQTERLCRWVNDGGGLLAIHSATVAARRHSNLKALIGGSFISHPPRGSFTVTPVADGHPIMRGVNPFTVDDELYLHDVNASARVHLEADHDGLRRPLAWSKVHGRGKVVYFALGHDEAAWDLTVYWKIVAQSLGWMSLAP